MEICSKVHDILCLFNKCQFPICLMLNTILFLLSYGKMHHYCILHTSKLRKELVLLHRPINPRLSLSFSLSVHPSYSLIHLLINVLFTKLDYILLSPASFSVKTLSIFKSGYEHEKILIFKVLGFQSLPECSAAIMHSLYKAGPS